MAEEKKTMRIWNQVAKTNPKFTRMISYGKRHFTAIDAYYQIKVATSLWGPYGSTWGLKETQLDFLDVPAPDKNGEKIAKMAIYKAIFYYPEGSFEIRNALKVSDDEFLKKLETDTLTKALSRLGFNADVFLGLFDDSRYVAAVRKEFEEKEQEETEKIEHPQPQSQTQSKLKDSKNLADAVRSLGLTLDGNIVKGKTYGKSMELKKLGFKWNPNQKVWCLPKSA